MMQAAQELMQRLAQARELAGGDLLGRLRARNSKADFTHLDYPGLWQRIGVPPTLDGDAEPDGEIEATKPQATKPTQAQPDDPQALLTMAQAAARLNITPEQVKAFVDDGELRFINLGRGAKKPRYRFQSSDLDDFLTRRSKQEATLCRSTPARSTKASTSSTSRSKVIGFTARRAALLAEKRKSTKR